MKIEINAKSLPIIYHKLPSGKIHVSLIAVPVATITYSETVKSWFVNFINISDVVAELETKKECVDLISEKVVEYLTDVFTPTP